MIEQIIVAMARMYLYEVNNKTFNSKIYKLAMEVAYDEDGCVRGSR